MAGSYYSKTPRTSGRFRRSPQARPVPGQAALQIQGHHPTAALHSRSPFLAGPMRLIFVRGSNLQSFLRISRCPQPKSLLTLPATSANRRLARFSPIHLGGSLIAPAKQHPSIIVFIVTRPCPSTTSAPSPYNPSPAHPPTAICGFPTRCCPSGSTSSPLGVFNTRHTFSGTRFVETVLPTVAVSVTISGTLRRCFSSVSPAVPLVHFLLLAGK